jgi:hypothetical protein
VFPSLVKSSVPGAKAPLDELDKSGREGSERSTVELLAADDLVDLTLRTD